MTGCAQPPSVTPILKDGSINTPLYSKYSLDAQLTHVVNTHRPKHTHRARHTHTLTQTHTHTYVHVLRCAGASHSLILLRIKKTTIIKVSPPQSIVFDVCFLCLSAPWWVSHLICAVQEEGQRSRLLFLQEEEEEESDRPAAHKSVPDWLKEKPPHTATATPSWFVGVPVTGRPVSGPRGR